MKILWSSIYVGLNILGLGKLLMYEFHYKYMQLKYDNSANLLFADTDSLVYEIETDVYENPLILSVKKWLVEWKMKWK